MGFGLVAGEPPPGRHPRSWMPGFWQGSYGHWHADHGLGPYVGRQECPATDGWDIVSYRLRTGSVQARHRCLTCGRVMSYSLPYTEAEAKRFPLAKDRVTGDACERCGATEGVEEHHWAPKAVFGWSEAEKWPVALLCRSCHRRWHQMMDRP
jgi:hypothetical protein